MTQIENQEFNWLLRQLCQNLTEEKYHESFSVAHNLAAIINKNIPGFHKHSLCVANLTRFIGHEMAAQYSTHELFYAGFLHDLGKAKVSHDIINKTKRLNSYEISHVQEHCKLGCEVVSHEMNSCVETIKQSILYHHENWTGDGYPNKAKSSEIPFIAQIVKMADVYDALRSKREYKVAYKHKDVIGIIQGDIRIESLKPEHFAPEIREVFLKKEKIFEDIHRESQKGNLLLL